MIEGRSCLHYFFRLFCGLLTPITDAARCIELIKAATAEDIYDLRFYCNRWSYLPALGYTWFLQCNH
jgi:hypothetical protein